MTPYACLRDLIYELKANPGDLNAPDVVGGTRMLRLSTAAISRRLRIRFQPFYETQQYDYRYWQIDSSMMLLNLPETLFSYTTVYDGNGNPIDPTFLKQIPAQVTPFESVQLTIRPTNLFGSTLVSWYRTVCPLYLGESLAAVQGMWGWHPDYANAWTNTLDTVQDNPMAVGANTLTVANAAGSDILGRSPRFSPGQLIQIDSEFMEVTVVTGNVLNVLRAQNGTTANSHTMGSVISVWDVPDDVLQATLRYAAYPFKRRGDYNKNASDGGNVRIALPPAMPGDVMELLQQYVNGVP